MNRTTLKLIALCLLLIAPLVTFINRGAAQAARGQNLNGVPPVAQVPPQEKTVGQTGKNIKVLNGLPQTQLYPAMRFMAASLGFQCGSCHVIRNGWIDAAADDNPEKQTAREMIKMVVEMNQTYFQGNPTVSCYTCHRGNRSPQGVPVLPLPTSLSSDGASTSASTISSTSASGLPSADDVLNKYLVAVGGKAAADMVTSCVIKGSTTTAAGQVIPYEAEQSAPDKGHETFALPNDGGSICAGDARCVFERVVNGREGWIKNGQGVQELVGEQLADQKLSFPLFQILRLKEQYTTFRVSGREKIDARDVYVVGAVRLDSRFERLYFDVENGLLRRRISYARTLVGMIPQQTDFDDYRDVDGLRLPFTITIAYADPGTPPIIRRFAEVKLNVPVDDSKFLKPTAPKPPGR
jgi:hypothetical protein